MAKIWHFLVKLTPKNSDRFLGGGKMGQKNFWQSLRREAKLKAHEFAHGCPAVTPPPFTGRLLVKISLAPEVLWMPKFFWELRCIWCTKVMENIFCRTTSTWASSLYVTPHILRYSPAKMDPKNEKKYFFNFCLLRGSCRKCFWALEHVLGL